MSTALGIASVTYCLKRILEKGLEANKVGDMITDAEEVTVFPPDKIDLTNEKTHLNLFMYQVGYNQGWRNVDLPSVNSRGDRISAPPLAIDLHYFLTAFEDKGQDQYLNAHILLGYGMQIFHETPVLDRGRIQSLLSAPSLNKPINRLIDSELANQAEQVKITPESLSIEDISKLWAAFGTKYRTTVAYKVTVVLIESNKPTKPGLPVLDRLIYANPMRQPVIEKILSKKDAASAASEDQKILPGYILILKGAQLYHKKATIEIISDNNREIPTAGILIAGDQLTFTLPADLKAGRHLLQVVHPIEMGSPPSEHLASRSAPVSFKISPSIITSNFNPPAGTLPATITITLKPDLYPGQQVSILMNEINNATDPKLYSFKNAPVPLLSPPGKTNKVIVEVTDIKTATYLLRLMVDGSESPLQSDGVSFVGPTINIP